MAFKPAIDCTHYLGDRPCRFKASCRCDHYEPMGHRILIIKLGALGDVVRTVCLLPTLKREYPTSHVTWVSRPAGVAILTGHPQIDLLAAFDGESVLALSQQRFDMVLSLDKEAAPTALCSEVSCPDKRGIGMSAFGTPEPCNAACEPYFQLALDDELKFRHNRKSYPQLIHEALALPYIRRPYQLFCGDKALQRARARLAGHCAESSVGVVGLNTGSGSVFANKSPRPSWWVELARQLRDRGCAVVLLGGPSERTINAWIAEQVGGGVHDAGTDNTEAEFVALISQCDVVVTGDTLALHVAVARRVAVVALFGPTCPQEIDLFGLGRKILSPVDCGPCYRRQCDRRPSCMDLMPADQVLAAVADHCRSRPTQRVAL